MAATDKQWFVGEDGCLSVGETVTGVTYHSSLNSIILTTKEPSLKILDATSGIVLQKSDLSVGQKHGNLHCVYLSEKEKTVFWDAHALGVRKDLRGVLLLDTALQIPVKHSEDLIKCELPLVEAGQLLKALMNADLPGVDSVEEVLKELERGIESTHEATKGNHKTSKWASVCITLPHMVLKSVCSGLVNELKRSNVHSPELSIASAISDRLCYLLPSTLPDIGSGHVERALMYSEAARRETFTKWPHMNYKWALPDPMAQAGFYHQPNASGDDRAMCFTCNVCLVCWEPTDEPWSEHERHSPSCPFVKGEYTQNVPFSVTYATQPAQLHGNPGEEIHCVGTTSDEDFFVTSTKHGNICVWSISRVLQKYCQFNLDPSETQVALKTGFQTDKVGETYRNTGVSRSREARQDDGEQKTQHNSECFGASSEDEIQEIPLHDEIADEPAIPTERARPSEDVFVTALCLLKKLKDSCGKDLSGNSDKTDIAKGYSSSQPSLLCGASLRQTRCTHIEDNQLQSSIADAKSETVQLMNKVNQVVSGDSPPRIISDTEEGDDFILPETKLLPYLLMVSVQTSINTSHIRQHFDSESVAKPPTGGENGVITPLGLSSMHPDWSMFLENDPWADPDVQIVGFTPSPMQTSQLKDSIPETSGKNNNDSSSSSLGVDMPVLQTVKMFDDFEKKEVKTQLPLRAGTVIQCLDLPKQFQREEYEIASITPSNDKQYVVVVVSPKKDCNKAESNSNTSNGVAGGSVNGDTEHAGGGIIVYKLKTDGSNTLLEETPSIVHVIERKENAVCSLLMLPQEVADQVEEEDCGTREQDSTLDSVIKPCSVPGQVALTLLCGSVWLVNLADMQLLAEMKPLEEEKFISIAYCTGIERLCVCTDTGKLHFYQISEQSPDLQDSAVEMEGISTKYLPETESSTCKKAKFEDVVDHAVGKPSSGMELLAKKPLAAETLSGLHSLTQFENLFPRYTATVPPCWSEIQQEQQQRRHPQHLQQQGETTQHTRTWKLAPDSTSNTWDEHLLEIVLPRPCCVGHVDLKFTVHPMCTTQPNIEVTLLKQNIGNIRKQSHGSRSVHVEVDEKVDFGNLASGGTQQEHSNNVLDPMFLESHNAEILCGPIQISACLDLSGNSGLVSLTSPQLLNSKPRSLLLHIKGFPNKAEDSNLTKETKKKMSTPVASTSNSSKQKTIKSLFENVPYMPGASVAERLAATAPHKQKLTDVKGCDWIQEISLTVRKMKKTNIPRERPQRNAMIEMQSFHERLLKLVAFPSENELVGIGTEHAQNIALDVLTWITAIQMNDPIKRKHSRCLVVVVQQHLRDIVKACLIDGTRTTAHKCSRLLALLLEYAKVSSDPDLAPAFSYLMLQAMISCLPLLPCATSAGAMKWFFTVLNHVKCMDINTVAKTCTELLCAIAKHYQERAVPLHALLKARYGLYGHPLEPDLFDLENPQSLKNTVKPSAFQIAKANNISAQSMSTTPTVQAALEATRQQDEPDLYEMLCLNSSQDKSGKSPVDYARNHVLGLLEAEPLHFTCHATSDGTRVERLDANGNTSLPSTAPLGMSGTINFGENPPPIISGGTGMTGMAMADSLKKLAQIYAKQLHPSYKQLEQAITEAIHTPGKKVTKAPELFPPTPKTTPNLMTPSVTPPNETWHVQVVAPPSVSKLMSGESDISKQQQQQQQTVAPQTISLSLAGGSGQPSTSQIQQQTQKASFAFPQNQALLQPPPPQVLVIERMHSGARRFVTLDFGKPILLTDVIIPACVDLASLSIDVWIQGEEVDGQRLVVASDIGLRTLVMNNIMPPPICRYLKITTVGRYGAGTTRSRIPIGAFYGHCYILPWEWKEYVEDQSAPSCSHSAAQLEVQGQSQLLSQLGLFMSLQEDLQCRYSLTKTRLESLLSAVDSMQFPASHVEYYLKKTKKNDEDNSIIQTYNDCLQLQLQLNLAQRAIVRLKRALGIKGREYEENVNVNNLLRQTSTDKLRVMLENLLDTLLSMSTSTPTIPQPPLSLYMALTPQTSETLFKNLCLLGSRRIQVSTGLLLSRICGSQTWWGTFLGNMLQEFFHSEYTQIFPQDRVFVLLSALGQKSLSGPSSVSIMESLLAMLAKVLSPLTNAPDAASHRNSIGCLDLSLVSWILLFLCRNFDNSFGLTPGVEESEKVNLRKDAGSCQANRWGFIQGHVSSNPSRSKSRSGKLYRRSLQKRILHHKQRLHDLELAKKKFVESQLEKSGGQAVVGKEAQALMKQQEQQFKKELSQYASKHLKDIVHIRRADAAMLQKLPGWREEGGAAPNGGEDESDTTLVLPRDRCLAVVRGLMALLLSMDFTCHVDLFLVACKVFARICNSTRPAITLTESMTQEQLEKLILLVANQEFNHGTITWGGPWASHAITCLLQDVQDGERLYPAMSGLSAIPDEMSATVAETDDSLAQSVSLPTFDDSNGEITDVESSQVEEVSTTLDKDSSMMVDLLLDDPDLDDDATDKLHEYVTGESVKPPPANDGPFHVVYMGLSDGPNQTMELADHIKSAMSGNLTSYDKKQKLKNLKSKLSDYLNTSKAGSGCQGLSSALDARLELGLETQAELRLKVMLSVQMDTVHSAFTSSLPPALSLANNTSTPLQPPSTDDELSEASIHPTHHRLQSSSEMLSQCFNHLFSQLLNRRVNLDTVLQLWLTMNEDSAHDDTPLHTSFDPSRIPSVPLTGSSLAHLLEAVVLTPNLPVRSWVFVFQTLCLFSNQRTASGPTGPDISMVNAVLKESNLMPLLVKFLSGVSTSGPTAASIYYSQVGPSATKAFDEFLRRMQIKSAESSTQNLRELMLKLVFTLTAERGAFYSCMGPLDAQCKFLEFVLDIQYGQVDINNAISVIQSISSLVHQHIICQERVTCRSSFENSVSARSCFGGLFAGLLRGGDTRTGLGDASRDRLMCSLLKLVNILVQVNIPSRNLRSSEIPSQERSDPTLTPMLLTNRLSDADKLSHVLATSTPVAAPVMAILSDDEKGHQTDEQKTESAAAVAAGMEMNNSDWRQTTDTNNCVAEIILTHQYIMQNFLQTLSFCNSNAMATLLGNAGVQNVQENLTGGDVVSVGDCVYQILVTLASCSSDTKPMLDSLFHYLSGSTLCRLSEPLLWFALRVLNSSHNIKQFLDIGGMEVVCSNLVSCNRRLICTNSSLISTIMQNMNNGRACANGDKINSTDSENTDGLQNFAPMGTVSSSSPTASPADVLIQTSPPHRRARSAAWSYHFYPDEAWVDLTIQLPFAVLLREVQIQPHGSSLATCPSFVSLEISHDGMTVTPMCPPLMTSSLAVIKLQLQKLEVTSSITIRLHKARDSMTIGLSQILLMGYSAFRDTGTKPGASFSAEDSVSHSSIGWIRLLHHCLTAFDDVEDRVAAAAASTPNLLTTCASLLVSPTAVIYTPKIEAVLLKIGLHSLPMGLALIDNILSSPPLARGNNAHPYLGKVSGVASESTVELLYQLGMVQDSGTKARVQAVLQWLGDSGQQAVQKNAGGGNDSGREAGGCMWLSNLPNPAPAHVHCIAAVLWQSQELQVQYGLSDIITIDLVSCLYEWSSMLPSDSLLKKSLDYVLCAACHIQPEFFTMILEWMGIIINFDHSMNASISDDCKDSFQFHQGTMTDDSKEASHVPPRSANSPPITLQELSHMMLDESRLATLALVCKSPVAIKQLLDSGFPTVLAQCLYEFCKNEFVRMSENNDAGNSRGGTNVVSEGITVIKEETPDLAETDKSWSLNGQLVAAILEFFAEVSSETLMKDWVGSQEGSVFWTMLLTMLCNTYSQTAHPAVHAPQIQLKVMTAEERSVLESSAVHFFTRVISCHSINQLFFAKVLCDVIREQGHARTGAIVSAVPLSGFTRRILLQVLLEDERILVAFHCTSVQCRLQTLTSGNQIHHPQYGAGRSYRTVMLNINTSCGDALNKVADAPVLTTPFLDVKDEKTKSNSSDEKIDPSISAKERREKSPSPTKSTLPPRPPTRRGRHTLEDVSSQLKFSMSSLQLHHKILPNKALPSELTLSQLVHLVEQRGEAMASSTCSCLQLTMRLQSARLQQMHTRTSTSVQEQDVGCTVPMEDWNMKEEDVPNEVLLCSATFPSALQVFASVGGLALLAEHLPLLYPEITRQAASPEATTDNNNVSDIGQDWVTVESSDEFYDPYVEPVSPAPTAQRTARHSSSGMPSIPPHSLIAFGLFLRLPGYAEVLLKERKKAQCLLRLVLGVTDDGDGGHILTSPLANSLPTLPFTVLKSLFDATPLTTDDGVLLRRMALDIGAVHLILACLSVLSHHAPRITSGTFQQEVTSSANHLPLSQTEEKTQHYWAKGTGFGTGSTTSSWDAEQALLRQRSEEEHVTCLLQVLGSYINAGGQLPKDFDNANYAPPSEKSLIPEVMLDLLSQSCLVPAISSYLRNDSVLDMARHVPLYRALLELLRGLAVSPSLVPLLRPLEKDGAPDSATAIEVLLDKMKGCVDTYASRLRSNKGKNGSSSNTPTPAKMEEEENEGLALLIPDIQDTAHIVRVATDRVRDTIDDTDSSSAQASDRDRAKCFHTLEEKYMMSMKELQFDTFEMVTEETGGLKFLVPHHFESNVKAAGEITSASRTRRLAQEAVTLSTSLPLSASSSVFVRCDEERLDIMKVLITGPSDTPYTNGCFEFDVYFPQDYPNSPPYINLETTGNHTIRFNPNLYNDGKVCLSVLNTWHGRPEEKWNSQTSSFLQVLVSIQSLILVNEPYFNEPGYERSRGTPSGTASSREYDANIRQATVKWAMLEMLRNSPPCFRDVIQRHFWLKRHEVLKQCEDWITEMETYSSDKRTGRSIAHNTLALKRHYNQLREELAKMKPPSEFEDEDEECIDPQGKHYSTDMAAAAAAAAAASSNQSSAVDHLSPGPSAGSAFTAPAAASMLLDPLGIGQEIPDC
ncbi:baculoviral IAP repeat-containing protein 6-like isoform X2 [Haliotis asinina]|uniref:baculoviral IAP repeat-containing protein 6-like isoform X2 n=1 Tax=Haliotis asinina TaxID=109174 RepID=UPI003531E6AA